MQTLTLQRLQRERQLLSMLAKSRVMTHPEGLLDHFQMRTAEGGKALDRAILFSLQRSRTSLASMAGRLEALSPLSVLSRGFAAVYRGENMITHATDVKTGDQLRIRFADGEVDAVAHQSKGE